MNIAHIFPIILRDSLNLLWLGCGLFLAGALESFLWKTPYFEYLNRPIHPIWFGANKRWRGLVSLPITHTLSTYLLSIPEKYLFSSELDFVLFSDFNCLVYGLLVGFVFNAAELPNSFIKRRLQISPGDESNQIFYCIDHMDSTFGVLLLWHFYFVFPLHLVLVGFIVSPFLFMGATELRKKLGLK